jgi:ABC-2 type transport system permease protein
MFSKIKEIFQWRELIFNLALRDLKAKYRQATGGFGWMLVRPLVQMLIFYFIFRVVFKVKIEKYPLFLLSGLFSWSFLHSSLDGAANSIIINANLVKKAYFPREVLPISVVLGNLANFLFSLIILFLFSLFLKVRLSYAIIWLPIVILTQMILTAGIAFLVSSLNVCFREIQFIMETLILVWFYATPIVYSLDMVKMALPINLAKLYLLNPITGVISSYQNIFVYGLSPDLGLLLNSLFVSLACLILGFSIFHHYEGIFVDII